MSFDRARRRGVPRWSLNRLLILALGLVALTGSAVAGQVSLTWDAVSAASGYRLHYGTASRSYSANLDVGQKTTATVSGLTEGNRYYFAVTTYTTAATSDHSNEVSALIPATTTPPVASFTANGSSASSLSVAQGQTINLADTSSGAVTSRSWNLGDGTSATSTTVIKAYSTTGTKTVVLSVTGAGVTKTASMTINVTAAGPGGGSGTIAGDGIEAAELKVDHQWLRVNFKSSFADPIVVAKPLSANGSDPAVVRVKGVDETGFWIRVQEWDYLDQWHSAETVSYLVMERGRHQLPDGAWVEAGRLVTDATNTFVAKTFSEPLYETPVVFATVTSVNEADAVTTRLRTISVKGFEVGMQEQESNIQKHLSESIDFIAWEPSFGVVDGMRFEVGLLDTGVTDKPQTLLYRGAYSRVALFLADMQSTNGSDPANLRWNDRDEVSLRLWVSEEQSIDEDTSHYAEAVGYLLIGQP